MFTRIREGVSRWLLFLANNPAKVILFIVLAGAMFQGLYVISPLYNVASGASYILYNTIIIPIIIGWSQLLLGLFGLAALFDKPRLIKTRSLAIVLFWLFIVKIFSLANILILSGLTGGGFISPIIALVTVGYLYLYCENKIGDE